LPLPCLDLPTGSRVHCTWPLHASNLPSACLLLASSLPLPCLSRAFYLALACLFLSVCTLRCSFFLPRLCLDLDYRLLCALYLARACLLLASCLSLVCILPGSCLKCLLPAFLQFTAVWKQCLSAPPLFPCLRVSCPAQPLVKVFTFLLCIFYDAAVRFLCSLLSLGTYIYVNLGLTDINCRLQGLLFPFSLACCVIYLEILSCISPYHPGSFLTSMPGIGMVPPALSSCCATARLLCPPSNRPDLPLPALSNSRIRS
jgi:hypothetical protein